MYYWQVSMIFFWLSMGSFWLVKCYISREGISTDWKNFSHAKTIFAELKTKAPFLDKALCLSSAAVGISIISVPIAFVVYFIKGV